MQRAGHDSYKAQPLGHVTSCFTDVMLSEASASEAIFSLSLHSQRYALNCTSHSSQPPSHRSKSHIVQKGLAVGFGGPSREKTQRTNSISHKRTEEPSHRRGITESGGWLGKLSGGLSVRHVARILTITPLSTQTILHKHNTADR